jgi:hypothetical protein
LIFCIFEALWHVEGVWHGFAGDGFGLLCVHLS